MMLFTPSMTTESSQLAYIALGSNLGNSEIILHEVFRRLEVFSQKPLLRSSLWKTTPVDCPPDSPPFLNAAAVLDPFPGETPESLLEKLQFLEREFGRTPKIIHNEARPLDLDLLAFGTESRATPRLTLPHPRAHQRRFVLVPLAEIAPGLILPGQTKSATDLLASLRTDEQIEKA